MTTKMLARKHNFQNISWGASTHAKAHDRPNHKMLACMYVADRGRLKGLKGLAVLRAASGCVVRKQITFCDSMRGT